MIKTLIGQIPIETRETGVNAFEIAHDKHLQFQEIARRINRHWRTNAKTGAVRVESFAEYLNQASPGFYKGYYLYAQQRMNPEK